MSQPRTPSYPTPPPDSMSAVTSSATLAWHRMVELLFTGPNATLVNWIWWGLIIMLAGLGGGGGGDGLRGDWDGGEFPGRGRWDLPEPGIIVAIVALVCLVFVLVLLWIFINSCFRFVLLDGVLSGEPRLRDVFSRSTGPGLQYFLLNIAVGLAAILAIGVPLLPFWLPLILRAGRHDVPVESLPLLIIPTVLWVACVAFAVGIFSLLVYDLVLPYAWIRSRGILSAMGDAMALVRSHPAAVLLFILARIIVGVVVTLAICLLCVMTCCAWLIPLLAVYGPLVGASVAFPPALIFTVPLMIAAGILFAWVVSTITAPIPISYRSWSLAFVHLLDPTLDIWSVSPPSPSEPAP
ncbi:MAG: hypothetical protein JSV80_05160 [Acidobacteriota bacterium]|nr:MAG: hypothetical protein JSV80_05160 [Acidobacteriota bacterium]